MVRNIVLAIATLAVLVIFFLTYSALVEEPTGTDTRHSAIDDVPAQDPHAQPVEVGPSKVELYPGGQIVYKVYDERTGRPTDMFKCQDWRPAPGLDNEIIVNAPELILLMPSGMTVTVSAEHGQIAVDRIDRTEMQPKLGWLEGDVRIVVDRSASRKNTPPAERTDDLVTVTMDRLEFDLEVGEMTTAAQVAVNSDEFDIVGDGLSLIWNQADNRIEKLVIERGAEFVLYTAAELITAGPREKPTTQPTGDPLAQTPAPRNSLRPRRTTTYECTLDDHVVVEQYADGKLVGGLEANQLIVMFDVGAGLGQSFGAGQPTATSAPASRPAPEQRDRLVVRWNGPLHLKPVLDQPPPNDEPRRHISASGTPLRLTRGDGQILCGQLDYHDETQRVWIAPEPDKQIEFGLGRNLNAQAAGAYIDRPERIIKLVGPVLLSSGDKSSQTGRPSSISAEYWAELHLAEAARTTSQPAANDPLSGAERLESATFVGDVHVDLGQQQLTAHQLDVVFRETGGDETLEELLDHAVASGDVTLGGDDGALQCAQLEVTFGLTEETHDLYPQRMHAVGSVVLQRGRDERPTPSLVHTLGMTSLWPQSQPPARITGDEITATLAPPPPDRGPDTPDLLVQNLDVSGRALLIDPDNRVGAKGTRIVASFTGENALSTASVWGTSSELGLVHAAPYTVRGQRIDLSAAGQTLHVDGPSQLSLKTQRSLQGQRRREPTPIVITCDEQLHIDGHQNEVRFVGNVQARSGQEDLRSRVLTLELEDTTPAPTTQPTDQMRTARRSLLAWLTGRNAADTQERPLDVQLIEQTDRIRKEPTWLIADDALVTSETSVPDSDSDRPLTHASISAPSLKVDVVNRQIFTTGLTQLLLTDRRGLNKLETSQAGQTLGVPSALISNGPSQTAMQCEDSMIYTLGTPGPDRRDTVVFQGNVLFAHRTGREMVNLEHMLPEISKYPNLLDTVESRNATLECSRLECWFTTPLDEPARPDNGALTARQQLASLIASGGVYLRDQESSRVREVHADWIEFDREQQTIDVRGTDEARARMYFQDLETEQFDVHTDKWLVINLADGTVRASGMEGQMHRP